MEFLPLYAHRNERIDDPAMNTSNASAKPDWLKKKINLSDTQELHRLFGSLRLHTVCKQAQCPNIGECFAAKVATFLLMGAACTRGCWFCNVGKAQPQPLDSDEPRRVAEAVRKLGLRHVVITSVTRDDLPDGGAGHFSRTIAAVHDVDAAITVEVLVPDFQGDVLAVETVLAAGPRIFAHNVETVPRLYSRVRRGADYQRSLGVLDAAKNRSESVPIKSGIMLGLGEEPEEVRQVLRDLRQVRCDFLSIGQYLAPSKHHAPVQRFVPPEEFLCYENEAKALGFAHVESGPYVRSSYIASSYLNGSKK